tara:strand:+ start:586 stop:1281 length:696 start_codon:yes stop_codon:yes gene_type:complete
MINKSSQNFECQYCKKAFKKETTLSAHLCEKKRRWQQEKETGVQFGLKAYLRFFEYTQTGKTKSYADFVESPYYIGFVKFGRHCVAIKCLHVVNFTNWLLKNNKKLDDWTRDSFYQEWMYEYLRKEAVQDALERALTQMQSYADKTDGMASFSDYFRYGNANRICYHIASGRISPWVIYNCDSGIEFLNSLGEEQVGMIMQWIDPDFWNSTVKELPSDTSWVKDILKQAGL